MIRSGINAELSKLLSSPPPWATTTEEGVASPYFLKSDSHKDLIESFLSATTDSVRLVRASKASSEILEEYDMAELEDLRATVQASELLRVIPYPRQTDHSAHTLYLFLLGVYLFFACKPLRVGIAKFLKEKDSDSSKLVDNFLFQWVFVSLLHDIGYIFQGRSKNEIRAVDRMFRGSTITSLLDSASDGVRRSVRKDIAKLEIKPFEPIQNPEDMLSALRLMPWGRSAGLADDIFESFNAWGPQNQQITANNLEDYAYRVASSGYDGFSEGTVDHAVASGLFLFRYSTLWFWLASENSFEEPLTAFRDNYSSRDIACACFAAAAHNIIGVHAKEIEPLDFEKNPLIYLGVLCDELQKWDRFPAGERHIVDLSSFEKYCTDSERIIVEGNWDGDDVVFRFEEEDLAESIKKALERLDTVDRFVKINPEERLEETTSTDQNSSAEAPTEEVTGQDSMPPPE
jgi:hypothetical protein